MANRIAIFSPKPYRSIDYCTCRGSDDFASHHITSPAQQTARQQSDPVASLTDWAPAIVGGANFRTRQLVKINEHRYEVKVSSTSKKCYTDFCIFIAVLFSVFIFSRTADDNSGLYFALLIGLFVLIAVTLSFYFMAKPAVFDRQQGAFWQSYSQGETGAMHKTTTPLDNIHALQVISEKCQNKNDTFTSYELNLILKDGSRVNVMDHANLEALMADTQTLGRFLDIEVWDEP